MAAVERPYSLASWRFWHAYGVTLRPYLLFVSGASGLVGLAQAEALRPAPMCLAALAFFLCYGLGQAITDAFQTDTDALSAPYRPLVRGEITRAQVLWLSLVALAAVATLLATLNPWTAAPAALAVAGVLLYTPFKRRWWGGPPWNSWVVAMLPLTGVLAGGGTPSQALARPGTWWAMGSVYFSYAVFVLLGYFKDVEADRATGYQTIVVRFGRRAALWTSALHAALAAACSVELVRAAASNAGAPGGVGAVLWVGGLLALAYAHWRISRTRHDDEAHPAIATVVAAFVAMHLGEAVLLRPGLAPAAALVFPLSVLVLLARPEKTQV